MAGMNGKVPEISAKQGVHRLYRMEVLRIIILTKGDYERTSAVMHLLKTI